MIPLSALLALGALAGPCPLDGAPAGVADLHVDLPHHVQYGGRPLELARAEGRSDVDTASLRAGCVTLLVLGVFTPHDLRAAPPDPARFEAALATAIQVRAAFHDQLPDIEVVLGIEGSEALANTPERVPALVHQGVRLFGLVHAWDNSLAGSSTDPRRRNLGLTAAGRRFVRAVLAAGALVDLAHASQAAFWDVAVLAHERGRPLVVSHAASRALRNHPRNLSDAQLREVARSGGVVGLTFHAPHLVDGPESTVGDVARHAAHLVEVMGPTHVAIGSDIDGRIRPVPGLRTHAGIPALVSALREAGLGGALSAILRSNAARVLRDGSGINGASGM